MKIQILSDIHLDVGNEEFKLKNSYNADILILAGDISNGIKEYYWKKVISWSTQYVKCIVVIGNHDYYNEKYTTVKEKILNFIKDTNIILLDNDVYEFNSFRFIGSTLWSNINPIEEQYVQASIADYRCILINTGNFIKIINTNYWHDISKYFLEQNVFENDIVITHYLPSYLSIAEEYKFSRYNSAFATELGYFILDRKPKIWIHGHTHYSFDYNIGNTRIICNPLDYFGRNKLFNKNLIVEL